MDLLRALVVGLIAVGGVGSASALVPCVGDCDANGLIAVNEVVVGIGIGLQVVPLDTCPTFDRNRDGNVAIDELIVAVDGLVEGCEPSTTPLRLVPVGSEFLANSTTAGQQLDPQVASDADGNFVVTWTGATASDSFGIGARRFASDGEPIGPDFAVNLQDYGVERNPDLAMRPDGTFLIVWERNSIDLEQNDPREGIHGQLYGSDGARVGVELKINAFDDDLEEVPAAAALTGGDFIVAWSSGNPADSSTTGVYARRLDAAGQAIGDEFSVNTYETGLQTRPAVAALPSGGFVVLWEDAYRDGNGFGVFGQRFDDRGAAIGSDFQVNTYTIGVQSRASVGVGADGSFLVAWRSSQLFTDDVFAQCFDSDGRRVGSELLVNTTQLGSQQYPSVAAEPDGGFLVVWQSMGGGSASFDIEAQHLDRRCSPVGEEFQVNTYTLPDRSRTAPEVAINEQGDVVAVWESQGQETDSFNDVGVYGRRYRLEP